MLDARGRVAALHVTERDDPAFVENTLQAIWMLRFKPATCDGVPVSSAMLIPTRFMVRGAGSF